MVEGMLFKIRILLPKDGIYLPNRYTTTTTMTNTKVKDNQPVKASGKTLLAAEGTT